MSCQFLSPSQSGSWGNVLAGVPQGSILGPLLFLIYINDLAADLECNVKLFADDTSLFTVVHDPNAASEKINNDLALVSQWAHDWRMSFNPDPQKQAVELPFSKKRLAVYTPCLHLNNIPVKQVEEHKHLALILDSKLSFSSHIKSSVSKARREMCLLKYLSKYLLIDLSKLHMRPYLDYRDVCNYSQDVSLPNLMVKN